MKLDTDDLILTDLTLFTTACPSQWFGLTKSGKRFYARFRWGELKIYLDNVLVLHKIYEDRESGFISEEDMLKDSGFDEEDSELPEQSSSVSTNGVS